MKPVCDRAHHTGRRKVSRGPSPVRVRAAALALTLALVLALPARPVRAQAVVWGGMTQEQLDRAYNQDFWDNDPPATGARNAALSDDVRARLGQPARLAYGPSEYERLDLYRTQAPHAPIMIFVHGGAWRAGSARESAVQAEMYVKAGANFVSLDFINVLQTEPRGDLMAMATQVRRAVAWVHQHADSLGGDPNRIYISGHSAGGHLGAVVMTTDWVKDYGLPQNLLKGGVLVSGLYELEPVALSSRREYVNFTPEVVEALSPQRRLRFLVAPVVVANGTVESPEFQRQSKDFAAALRTAGKPVKYVVAVGYNHFEMPDALANPYGVTGRATLELMGLPVTWEESRGKK